MTSIYILVTLNKLSMEPKYFAFGGNWTPLHHFLTFGEPGFLGTLNFNLQIVIPTSQTSQKNPPVSCPFNQTNQPFLLRNSGSNQLPMTKQKPQQNREDSKPPPTGFPTQRDLISDSPKTWEVKVRVLFGGG